MKTITLTLISGFLILFSCNKPKDDNGSGTPGGAVEITATPANFSFWGDTITIKGKGFGSTMSDVDVTFLSNRGNYTLASGKIKMVSVAPTEIKVTVPLDKTPAGNNDGPDNAKIVVKVKSNADTTANIMFVGPPQINSFCYFYGGIGATARAGDSTILSVVIPGLFGQTSGYYDKVKVEGQGTIRRSAGTCNGYAMFMSPNKYGSTSCANDPYFGEPAQEYNFKVYIEGTNKSVSKNLSVLTQPKISVNQVTGPTQISKLAPGNTTWTIIGRNLNFSTIKYIGNGISTSTSITSCNWCDQTSFQIQLADLPAGPLPNGASYSVIAIGPCAKEYQLGSVTIIP